MSPLQSVGDDVHICEDISEVGMKLDDLDGGMTFALDAVRQLQFDIQSRIFLVFFEWLAAVSL